MQSVDAYSPRALGSPLNIYINYVYSGFVTVHGVALPLSTLTLNTKLVLL